MKVNVTIEEYHADKSAISSSAFYHLAKCPAYYLSYKQGRFNKDAPHFRLGSAVHTRILEPEKFDEEFIVSPKIDGRTTEGKKLKQEFEEKAQGKTILTPEEFDQTRYMADSVFRHSHAMDLLGLGGDPEVSFFWEEPLYSDYFNTSVGCSFCGHINPDFVIIQSEEPLSCESCGQPVYRQGVWSKTRPDYIAYDTIVDVKTTKSIAGFQGSMNTFFYDSQAAFQIAGATRGANEGEYNIQNYYWLVVEKEYPYLTAIFKASPNTLEQGRQRYSHLLHVYKKALDTGNWFAYPEIIEI